MIQIPNTDVNTGGVNRELVVLPDGGCSPVYSGEKLYGMPGRIEYLFFITYVTQDCPLSGLIWKLHPDPLFVLAGLPHPVRIHTLARAGRVGEKHPNPNSPDRVTVLPVRGSPRQGGMLHEAG